MHGSGAERQLHARRLLHESQNRFSASGINLQGGLLKQQGHLYGHVLWSK